MPKTLIVVHPARLRPGPGINGLPDAAQRRGLRHGRAWRLSRTPAAGNASGEDGVVRTQEDNGPGAGRRLAMGEALTIQVRRDRGYTIVAVTGEVDIATVTR